MKKRIVLLSAIFFTSLLIGTSNAETWRPGFYPFQNGLDFGTYENEAKILKELGYDGATSVKSTGEKLAERIKIYDNYGLRIPSLYMHLKEQPISADTIKPLGETGGMLELMVKNMNPQVMAALKKTIETADQLNVRVALYPHAGCAIDTISSALKAIEEVDSPNLGTSFNLCHFLIAEDADTLEAVLERASPRLWAVSTCGANIDGKNFRAVIKRLDEGSFPQERLFRALKKMDYQGPVGLQCHKIPGDNKENLKKSIAAWNKIIEKVNSEEPDQKQ